MSENKEVFKLNVNPNPSKEQLLMMKDFISSTIEQGTILLPSGDDLNTIYHVDIDEEGNITSMTTTEMTGNLMSDGTVKNVDGTITKVNEDDWNTIKKLKNTD